MSGLAKYLIEQGFEVSGSDVYGGKYTKLLEEFGAYVFIGHDEANLPDDAIVIASTAIKEDNPELKKARRLGLSVLHRSDLLAEIANKGDKCFLGYAGTHGKTTTSGFASYVLAKGGYDPSYIVGGFVPELNANAHGTRGKYFVAELDESDGTIVKYTPNVAIINNLEPDHLDFFKGGLEEILETFEKFLDNLRPDAIVLANADCENVMKLVEGREVVTYGLSDADYTAKNIEYNSDCTTFDIYHKGEFLTDLKIIVKGKHNVYNALSVFVSLKEAGVDIEKIKPHFATFTGMGRRFEKVAELDGVTVYDDYAHHPTEIKATLDAAQSLEGNVVAVFQPHRYTRLKELWNEFLNSFEGADRVVVTDIYSASENPIEGISAEKFTSELSEKLDVPVEHLSGDMKEFARELLPTLKSDDIVIGMGAGTITYLGKELLEVQSLTSKTDG